MTVFWCNGEACFYDRANLDRSLALEPCEYSRVGCVSCLHDEFSAQSRESGRKVLNSDLYVLNNDEHWTMTPETHKYAHAAASFCFVTTENVDWQDMKFDHYAVCTTIIVPQ